jgi:ABC-type multidrug transport system fused ATPase/permease subunit
MLSLVPKLWALLTPREHWRLAGLSVMVVLMGVAQVVGVGSIAPFVSVLVNPGSVETNSGLRWTFETLGFESIDSFLLFLALMVLAGLVLANGFLAIVQWMLIRFAWALQLRLSRQLLEAYLAQPYVAFLGRNSADTGKNILSESSTLTNGVMIPLLRMTAFGVSGLLVLTALLWINPLLTGAIIALLGVGYMAIYLVVRQRLSRAGQRRIDANSDRFKAVSEAFGSIKEMKVLGREDSLVEQYRDSARRFAGASVTAEVLAQMPSYGMQVVAGGALLLVTMLLTRTTEGPLTDVAPLLALYAFGAQRLMPSLAQIYQGASALRFNGVVVETLYNDMVEGVGRPDSRTRQRRTAVEERLPFEREIRLDRVTLHYPGASTPALQEVTLRIPHQTFVAFVGSTGAGKTTLVDIILGLLQPEQGVLAVDGTVVDQSNVRAWQNSLGYVPQDIYLTDDSVAANIAFGVPPAQRDQAAIERAAAVANIHEFIAGLPGGYGTVVGERGVRISGGQRQRIGIARALYHDPAVLVLDEATSNLDQETERAVHQAIEQVASAKTVIMIAHRLSVTRHCDMLYLLDHGRLTAEGSYETLLANSNRFRDMAEMAEAGSSQDSRLGQA